VSTLSWSYAVNTFVARLTSQTETSCALVGLGLIGSAVKKHLQKDCQDVLALTLDWRESTAVVSQLVAAAEERDSQSFELVWCAGKAGFFSSDEDLAAEYELFTGVVSALKSVYGSRLGVTLLSSAGGIYEGATVVCGLEDVAVERPYGSWKLRQEQWLAEEGVAARVYRVSSAYGDIEAGQRAGLINRLLECALSGAVAEVFASPSTLRDYVFANDVGRYIGNAVVEQRERATYLLATGRPVSVDGLIKMVSAISHRRVRVQYRAQQENQSDIVFQRHLIPADFTVSTLEEVVRLLARRRLGGVQYESMAC
jgi:UDP-glucose 4-epimerase